LEYRGLDQVLDLIIDHRGKTAPKLGGRWENEGIPVISANNLRDGQFVEMDSVKHIRKQLFNKWMPTELEEGDVLLVSEGATFGQVLYLRRKIQAAVGQRLFALRCSDSYLGRYLYYYLKSRIGQSELNSRTTGTSVLGIRQSELTKIRVPNIQKEVQRGISDVLGSIDDKILLNCEMNKTLERMGQLIFKHWFIDFEFPNDEGKPYKSLGGEMVYNEELGKEIPKGWDVRPLNEFGEVICGKTPPKSDKRFFGGSVPFIRIPDMHNQLFVIDTEDSLTEDGKKYQDSKTLPMGSVCVSCIATIGLVSITSEESQTNQQINSIVPFDERSRYYLFFQMKSMKRDLEDMGSGGSTTLNINTNSFSNIRIICPKQGSMKEFHETVKALFGRLLNNSIESRSLSQIRDSVLPKLMSGKVRVSIEGR